MICSDSNTNLSSIFPPGHKPKTLALKILFDDTRLEILC